MKKYLLKLSIGIAILFFYINDCNAVYVVDTSSNSTVTRGKCKYTLSGSYVVSWHLDTTACVQTLPDGQIDPDGFKYFYDALYVKWKNIEANADKQWIFATYGNLHNLTKTIEVGPFTLDMPTPTFSSGSSYNIPCYVNTPVTISLNPYINTEDNGIDMGEVITSHFEWTLPSGWQTTSGQTGTFVSSSSISVIPQASTSVTSITVRAKANTQYSPSVTLQITRNHGNFTISGPTSVYYNSTYRYTAPSGTGVNYTWELPAGWTGQSTGSYIDVVAGCSTGNISCTITACNQTIIKKSLPITSVSINPATVISGSSLVCSSGNTFTFNNLPPVDSIVWSCGPGLSITSGQNTSNCTFSATGIVNSWIKAMLVTPCGTTFPLPQKNVTGGLTASFTGSASVNYGGTGTWNATASGCPGPYYYEWWLREDTTPPVGAIMVGEGSSLTLWSVPRSSLAAGVEQGLSDLEMLQPPTYTNYYLSLQVFDANGMRFDTQERQITAYGDVDLIDPRARMAFAKTGETTSTQMKISPNPATDEATIELCAIGTKGPEISEWQVEIYDPSQMLKTKIQKIKGNKQSIRTAGWKDGVYIVRAKVGNEILTEKLVIKH